MLSLINKDRQAAGLLPVILGTNNASQKHAEEMLANGYLSHWGLDGMKPYIRYTLAGGYNYEAENISAPDSFINENGLYAKKDILQRLGEVEQGLMDSPGHKKNILNKWHKKVNIGIAYNSVTQAVVQQFEGDYIKFIQTPSLKNGVLLTSGETSVGFVIDGIQVWYDQAPHPLTLGQLGQTYAYNAGKPVTFLRPAASPSYYYSENQAQYSWETQGADPYSVSPNTDPPVSIPFSIKLIYPVTINSATVKWIDARRWSIVGKSFSIEADLNSIIAQYGKGVYTVRIWAKSGSEDVEVTNYSIFI